MSWVRASTCLGLQALILPSFSLLVRCRAPHLQEVAGHHARGLSLRPQGGELPHSALDAMREMSLSHLHAASATSSP